ncbi:MAG: imidazole glycerol phosphate synthase subunit HisH [Defluviicoccus sp.]
MSVALIDYGSGNLRSAAKAFEHVIKALDLAMAVRVTGDPRDVRAASHIVLPGVGAFGDCRRGLDALGGMIEALTRAVLDDGRPFLGICVGMQLLADVGREHGDHPGLGWIPGEVVLMAEARAQGLKIPHMGWNALTRVQPTHPVLAGLGEGAHAYFVHSYALKPERPEHILAQVDYGGPVTAVVGRDNIVGTQFHPEKSQRVGLTLIGNYLKWRP